MAIIITEECINCGACEPECPNTAIYEGGIEWTWAGGTSLTKVELEDGSSMDAKTNIEAAKERLADAIKNNTGDIRPAMDALNQLWSETSTKMYEQADAAGSTSGTQDASGDAGNVEEADYTIVDDKNDGK